MMISIFETLICIMIISVMHLETKLETLFQVKFVKVNRLWPCYFLARISILQIVFAIIPMV